MGPFQHENVIFQKWGGGQRLFAFFSKIHQFLADDGNLLFPSFAIEFMHKCAVYLNISVGRPKYLRRMEPKKEIVR